MFLRMKMGPSGLIFGLIPILSVYACFVSRPEQYRQENTLTDEREAVSPD